MERKKETELIEKTLKLEVKSSNVFVRNSKVSELKHLDYDMAKQLGFSDNNRIDITHILDFNPYPIRARNKEMTDLDWDFHNSDSEHQGKKNEGTGLSSND